jgi:hypothetical protein
MAPDTVWIVVLVASVAGITLLTAMHRRSRAALQRRRSALFEPAYELFQSYRVIQDGIGYPVLEGRYQGHTFHLDAIVDTLTFRRLPVLWLRVSLLEDLPGTATLDVLVRSQNTEFYSPGNDLPHALPPRAGWPADAVVRTDDPRRIPDLTVVGRHMPVFDRPQTKELLVTAKGVRIVHMLDQARRAEYLVLRQAEFEQGMVDRNMLRDLMDRTIAIHQDLAGNQGTA